MKHIPRWVDWIIVLVGITVLAAIIVTLEGCGDSPRMPPSPELCGPPSPTAQPASPADPLLPLLAWLSWISVAGMAACTAAAIFLGVFRSLAITGFISFAAVLTFARTLGHALPWLPWIGLVVAVVGIGYLLIGRYRSVALAAVDHGEMADDFILGLDRIVTDTTQLQRIRDEWHAAKQVSGSMQGKLQNHIKALIKKVNS